MGIDSFETVDRVTGVVTLVRTSGLVSIVEIEEMEVFTLPPDENPHHYQYYLQRDRQQHRRRFEPKLHQFC